MRFHPVDARIDTSNPGLGQLVEDGSEEFSWSLMNPLALSEELMSSQYLNTPIKINFSKL